MSSTNQVALLYRSVISDVVGQVKEAFLDEGVDVGVLDQLKQEWESKVTASGCVDYDGRGQRGLAVARPGVIRGGAPQPPTAGALAAARARQQPQFVYAQLAPGATSGFLPPGAALLPTVAAPPLYGHVVRPQQVLVTRPLVATKREPDAQLDGPVPVAAAPSSRAERAMKRERSVAGGSPRAKTEQVDGPGGGGVSELDDSDSDGDVDDLQRIVAGGGGDEDDDVDVDDEPDAAPVQEEDADPLNSGDDQSDEEDVSALFEADNVVVCQFEKVTRARNKWKFVLKDGVMNINKRDYVFQRATGEGEW